MTAPTPRSVTEHDSHYRDSDTAIAMATVAQLERIADALEEQNRLLDSDTDNSA